MRPLRLLALVAGLALAAGSAFTAASSVAPSRVGAGSLAQSANSLKPPECAGLNLTTIRTAGGPGGGSNQPSLVLGTPARDRINGGNGGDCILGGGGNDTLRGNGGVDVCIGGPGADSLHGSCETRIQ
jgi:Ca2+-binding RTX toxin-like protein